MQQIMVVLPETFLRTAMGWASEQLAALYRVNVRVFENKTERGFRSEMTIIRFDCLCLFRGWLSGANLSLDCRNATSD